MVKIFIGKLAENSSSHDLRALFEKYGKVTECDIVGNYGFVHMEKEGDANKAISAIDGYELDGSNIKVELSHGRKAGGGRNGGGPMMRGRGGPRFGGYGGGDYAPSFRGGRGGSSFGGSRGSPYGRPPRGGSSGPPRSGPPRGRGGSRGGGSNGYYGAPSDPYGGEYDAYASGGPPPSRYDPYGPSDPYADPYGYGAGAYDDGYSNGAAHADPYGYGQPDPYAASAPPPYGGNPAEHFYYADEGAGGPPPRSSYGAPPIDRYNPYPGGVGAPPSRGSAPRGRGRVMSR